MTIYYDPFTQRFVFDQFFVSRRESLRLIMSHYFHHMCGYDYVPVDLNELARVRIEAWRNAQAKLPSDSESNHTHQHPAHSGLRNPYHPSRKQRK